jgi:predicted GNAT family N-acyltransferase
MSTLFVVLVPPPGSSLKDYNPNLPPSRQIPNTIQKSFIDAMVVRQQVYVEEQRIPLQNELDEDDARCWHWVAYAEPSDILSADKASQVTAIQHPVATLRLVPPPHSMHPVPGSVMVLNPDTGTPIWSMLDGSDYAVRCTAYEASVRGGTMEPYIKLGRLATSPSFRGLGLARTLINSALKWAATHPSDILPPNGADNSTTGPVKEKYASDDGLWHHRKDWKGLVLVHAQAVVEKVWAKAGFVKDENMGVWWEEGIEHIGMWKKMEIKVE